MRAGFVGSPARTSVEFAIVPQDQKGFHAERADIQRTINFGSSHPIARIYRGRIGILRLRHFVFLANVIGKLFFAASLPEWVRQAQTFGIFAAGYLARPLGGIVMAYFGDTRGRKRMFTLSVLLMAIPTLLIGLLPTYQSIGLVAPLLLLSMRVLQGVAIGGEAPGAWVFVAEHARRGRVGFAVGLLTGGLSFGILLGSLIATCLNQVFSQDQIAGGAWRIPFLIGAVFGFIAM